MKALSIRQPWASMIARGEKTIEIRSWGTRYRGPLVICAGKTVAPEDKEDCRDLPRGCIVAVARLVDCRPALPSDHVVACCDPDPDTDWAWILKQAEEAPHPWKVRGKQGLFDLPAIPADARLWIATMTKGWRVHWVDSLPNRKPPEDPKGGVTYYF